MRKESADALRDKAFIAVERLADNGVATRTEMARLEALRGLAELTGYVENQKWILVGALRESGVTWAVIGTALGVTRSAAQQKYSV